MSIDYHPLAYSHMRNPNVSTEILGNISQGMSHQDEHQGALYAVGQRTIMNLSYDTVVTLDVFSNTGWYPDDGTR